jgi:hypothetical protein
MSVHRGSTRGIDGGQFPGKDGRLGLEVLAKNCSAKVRDPSLFRVANRLRFSSVKTARFLSKSDEVIFILRNPSNRS